MRGALAKLAATLGVVLSALAAGAPATSAAAVPPSLRGLTASPASASVSDGNAVFTFKFSILASAPVTRGCIALQDPQANHFPGSCFTSADLVSGTSTNGVFQTTVTLDQHSHTGNWNITTVTLQDSDGDGMVYANADLIALHFTDHVSVSGTSDVTAPSLVGLTFSPTSGDLAGGPLTITATMHVTDDLSGFASGCLGFGSPAAPTQVAATICFSEPADRISGTPLDGVYRSSVVFSAGLVVGTWPVLTLSLQDAVFNDTNVDSAALISAGAPPAIDVTDSDATDPGPPVAVTATAAIQSADVSWTTPASDGDSAILSYTVTATPGGSTVTVPASQTTAHVGDLIGTVSYTFTVHATNILGSSIESAPSQPITVPASFPDRPTGVAATAGVGEAVVSWAAPNDEGSPITAYTVTANTNGPSVTVAGDQTSTTFPGLIGGGDTYSFTVTATNALGSGLPSAASNTVTIATGVPDEPLSVSATAGDGEVSLIWSAPANDGGSPITGYTIANGATTTTVPGDQHALTISGLPDGDEFQLSIYATNTVGNGPAQLSNVVTTEPTTVPGAPTGVVATAGDGSATVRWVPSCCGVLSYDATASPGNRSVSVDATQGSATIVGLTNGVTYTLTVTAVNELGSSAPSAPSNPVTPTGAVLPAPTVVVATAGDEEASISWTPPAGASVDSYNIASSPQEPPLTLPGSATAATFQGLTNGSTYTFTVNAVYADGSSAASAPSNPVVPAGPPFQPFQVIARPVSGGALVSWQKPPSDNGSAITGYSIATSPATTVTVTDTRTAQLVSGLTNGVSYSFTVTARNAVGDGIPSAPSAAVTPAGSPSGVAAVHASIRGGSVSVSWTAPADNGSVITSYALEFLPDGRTASVAGRTTHVTLSALASGTYRFRVRASNEIGAGAWSAASNPVTIVGRQGVAGAGYWMLGADGRVYAFGAAPNLGRASHPAVAIATRRDGKGYWVTDALGDVSAFGAAANFGGSPHLRARELVTAMSATPSGNGYWLFTNRGRSFHFGDARNYGDMAHVALKGPIVASVATATGHGYYMVGSDGGVFSFGDARFHGSTGGMHLNDPIVGIAPTPDGRGYWLVASDGGVFAFNAPFRGSTGGLRLSRPVNGLVAYGNGYLMVSSDGGVFDFSDQPFAGSLGNHPPSAPIIGIAAFAAG